jgi:hypothetical protein
MDNSQKISCPHCSWEPGSSDRWMCNCGHKWYTFDTFGKCPACGFIHKYTECMMCFVYSKHIDWYKIPSNFLLKIVRELESLGSENKDN